MANDVVWNAQASLVFDVPPVIKDAIDVVTEVLESYHH